MKDAGDIRGTRTRVLHDFEGGLVYLDRLGFASRRGGFIPMQVQQHYLVVTLKKIEDASDGYPIHLTYRPFIDDTGLRYPWLSSFEIKRHDGRKVIVEMKGTQRNPSRNPPRAAAEATAYYLRENFGNVPAARRLATQLETATTDTSRRQLLRDAGQLLLILQGDEPPQVVDPHELDRALLAGTLELGQHGLAAATPPIRPRLHPPTAPVRVPPAGATHWLIVKGTLDEAISEASQYGVTFLEPSQANREIRTWAQVEEETKLGEWFAHTTIAPFPPGALLWYQSVAEPTLILDAFQRAYIEAALWSTTDDAGVPLDESYDEGDIAPETIREMKSDCDSFRAAAGLELRLRMAQLDDSANGHNFWLTRNRHGSGFWDMDLGGVEHRLTELAQSFGEYTLYVGDDGQIHGT